MADLNKDTTITISAFHAAWIAACSVVGLLGGLWIVWSLVMGDVKDDVASIRDTLKEMQAGSTTTLQSAHATETDLRGQLSELTAQLREATAEMSGLTRSVSGLDGSIQAIDAKLTQSISAE